ncbi:hypothetical protein [Rhodococcus sp. IEGM 1318]|uniref:hypothetical protein n=1 Tax=Rhodococcus sp. IEGM 1318 TaxID=3082226 RepID=UPI0029546A48|nr:hypothetical protein [Rhodococcus sp. IEGM 1318]MDV8003853.1 hypothetical protein [Rhodococcus sp. IEGM 1318]
MDLLGSLQSLVDLLNSVDGLHAVLDPRDINPDCVFVDLESLSHEYLCGQAEMTIKLTLITGDVGRPQALINLSALLDKVLTVLNPDGDTQVGVITPPGFSGQPLPVLVVTVKVPTS